MKFNDIEIQHIGWAGFKIKYNGKVIYIDPWKAGDEKADLILITHEHFDHCDGGTIRNLMKPGTEILGPASVESKIPLNVTVMKPSDLKNINGIKIRAVESYNIGKEFHKKEDDKLGFLIEINNTKIYHAGDTDFIPEMKKCKCDVALLPVGGTYVMNVDEALSALKMIKPKAVWPMHYGKYESLSLDADIKKFKAEAKKLGIEVIS